MKVSVMRLEYYKRLGIAAKLYWVAALSIIAIAILAISSIHFARVTQIAATQLNLEGFDGIENSSQLQSLLARHRQIVESAPAEVDRKRLEDSQRQFIAMSSQLSSLLNELTRKKSEPISDEIEAQMAQKFPHLITAGQEVMFYAYNFAQDKALESAAVYAMRADGLQEAIHKYRVHRTLVAADSMSSLMKSAQSLQLWVSISAIAAFIFIGPLGLTITRGVLRRLNRITTFMSRLANEVSVEEVPSRNDGDEVGDMARAVQVFKNNAAELFKNKMQLEQANVRLDLALNNMVHGLCMFDARKTLTICNDRYAKMYELPAKLTAPGTQLNDILKHLVDKKITTENLEEVQFGVDALTTNGTGNVFRALVDGRIIAISRQATSDGGWVSVHEDITERQNAQTHIAHLARHDSLTDLPNRTFLSDELNKCFQRLHDGQKFAVLCLDLDRFKGVNDTLGHSVGDKLLAAVAKRILGCVKGRDFIARLGGDEFAVIHRDLARPIDSGTLAGRIIERISAPYQIDGQQINIGASIGVAVAPSDGATPDQLLKNADLAMYRAKADGRGTYRFFEQEMDARIQARRALELELRGGLTSGQLQLYYQPLVDPRSGEVRCFEALLRWFHPRLGEIPPAEFVPIAEESGLIESLGEWVLRSACADAAKWPKHFRVAINLSPIQFRNPNLAKVVFSSLAASGLAASRLELEITESLLLEEDAKTIAMLHEFRSLGVRIAMDDFGTGFSSLNYLRSFPFDKIKIDKSFIRDMSKGGDAVTIVKAIIELAHNLKIDVVAEGVETAEQLKYLISEGCNEVQGHYFSAAQPIKYFEKVFSQTSGRIEIAA
jgi:diguanylate cyclase (GGDEF)-like protein